MFHIRKPLILIGSVYNEQSTKWLALQQEFLKTTASKYEFVVYFNGTKPPEKVDILGINLQSKDSRAEHLLGFNKILDYFKEEKRFSHCLILDSDAFPIKNEWDKILLKKIEPFGMACVIRFENLDTFPHPCVFFTDRKSVDNVNPRMSEQKNLLGRKFKEFNLDIKQPFFPLLKTNTYSPHPIISTIYYNLFYHHGFGSRNFYCRSVHVDNYYETKNSVKSLYDELIENPKLYIKRLNENA